MGNAENSMLKPFAEYKLCLIFNQCDSVCKGIINIVTFLQCHFSRKLKCPDTLQEMQCVESIHDAMLGMRSIVSFPGLADYNTKE